VKNNKTNFIFFDKPNFNSLLRKLLLSKNENIEDVSEIVKNIIFKVKNRGDKGLLSLIKKFDDDKINNLDEIKISHKIMKKAFHDLPLDQKNALKFTVNRIRSFHEKQIPKNLDYKDELDVRLGLKFEPINSVGFYVPGGKAIYPSSIIMNVIPSLVAGVSDRKLVTPISVKNPPQIILATAYLTEVNELYAMGGAHSIAALAFGTESIDRVDKIVGPGNMFVAEAKRQVFGKVGIDSIAGPSEILIVTDNKSNPEWIAYDLLSQSEHDEDAQAILITDDKEFAKRVENSIELALKTLPRKKIASASWFTKGCIIVLENLEQSIDLINSIAPEHLEIAINNPNKFLKRIKNAGSIFLGRYTPEAIGDYVAGPNHVLPTGGTAKFSSGLGVADFMKRSTFIECNKNNLFLLREYASILASLEGLDAHKISMDIRK
jgi:histidinol dehydrogenase